MTICEALGSFLKTCCRPEATDLYFDLSSVDWLDSTFVGFLLSHGVKNIDASRPAIHLFAPSAQVLDIFRTMHVLRLFDICDRVPAPAEWRELPKQCPTPSRVADLVIDAHEELIQADPRNASTFQPVVNHFRSFREREQGG